MGKQRVEFEAFRKSDQQAAQRLPGGCPGFATARGREALEQQADDGQPALAGEG